MKQPDWNDLRYFLVTARRGSATDAAKELGVSVSTVTRRVAALEEALGTRLFDRARGGHAPTAAGCRLMEHADRMEQLMRTAEDEVRGGDREPVGALRVACAEAVAHNVLIPRLADFHARYPRLRLELLVGPGMVSLGRREADCAIRLSRPERGDFIVSRIGRLAFAYYARPADLPALDDTSQPKARPIVGWDRILAETASARLMHPDVDADAAPFTIDTATGHLIAAQHGAGPCLIACITGDRTDGLVRWPTGGIAGRRDIWFVVRAGIAETRRVRAFRDFVDAAFRAERRALEGDSAPRSG